jgi:predicted nucleic acid-binding protein
MPAESLCLDANVFVAALVPSEPSHQVAFELLATIQEEGIPLYEPEVVLFEVGTALHRKTISGELRDSEADGLMNLFFRYPLIFQWESFLVRRASKIAKSLNEKGMADSYYLALAEKRKIPLVTLDRNLIQKGRKLYDKILDVREVRLSPTTVS